MESPPRSSRPLLDVRVRPRMSLYTVGETEGSFIVDARISHTIGEPFVNKTSVPGSTQAPFTQLFVDISVAGTGNDLVSSAKIPVDSSSNELMFSLTSIPARLEPYTITMTGASSDGKQVYSAQTQLHMLPARGDGGSVVKVDSLHGGLMVQELLSSSSDFTPFFPYGYYSSWDSFLDSSIGNINAYQSHGYNVLHITPAGGHPTQAYNFTQLGMFLDRAQELGLWVVFDMRWTYLNITDVAFQIKALQSRRNILSWYTADEPDGQQDPLNGTRLAYNTIKSIDPYRPVSLVLNCYNFYYEDYTSGADIVLEDVYPIGINATFSGPWGTPCNSTYGDCGCDDCIGQFEDISTRLDNIAQYQSWIGGPPKPLWGVPQAFGADTYWPRYPTAAEEATMTLLSVNHGAKGITMWDWPTTTDLTSMTSQLSRMLSAQDVASFVLGAETVPLTTSGAKRIDAAGWMVGGQMLVSVVFLQNDDSAAQITIKLPAAATSVASMQWGSGGWTVEGNTLVKKGLAALEADVLTLNMA